MDDIGLFEIIVILGIVGVGIYFLVQAGKWFTGSCVPSSSNIVTKAAGAVADAVGNTAHKVAGPVCTNPTPAQPQCNQSTGQKFFNWLGNLFGLSGGVNAQDKYYNPPAPAATTGVTPGAGQPCGCIAGVLSCCSGWCTLNYSQGG